MTLLTQHYYKLSITSVADYPLTLQYGKIYQCMTSTQELVGKQT